VNDTVSQDKIEETSIFSLIVPCYNEEDNIGILSSEISKVMNEINNPWECLWVDDCSSDATWKNIISLDNPNRGLRLERNSGQSTAIMAGIDNSKYDLIITLDGDLQNDPADIPRLIAEYRRGGVDIVAGVRKKRNDRWLRKYLSKIANSISKKITGVHISDLGCTIRIFKKPLLQQTRLFGEMHRILIVHLVLNGAKFREIQVNHRPRLYGKSKYGYSRIFKFINDVLLAKTLQLMNTKPLYLFSFSSSIVLVLSAILFFTAIGFRIFGIKEYLDTSLISGSIVLFSTSLVLTSIGLLAETLLRQNYVLGVIKQYKISDSNNILSI